MLILNSWRNFRRIIPTLITIIGLSFYVVSFYLICKELASDLFQFSFFSFVFDFKLILRTGSAIMVHGRLYINFITNQNILFYIWILTDDVRNYIYWKWIVAWKLQDICLLEKLWMKIIYTISDFYAIQCFFNKIGFKNFQHTPFL